MKPEKFIMVTRVLIKSRSPNGRLTTIANNQVY